MGRRQFMLSTLALAVQGAFASGPGKVGKFGTYAPVKFPLGAQFLMMTYGSCGGGPTIGGQGGSASVTSSINGGSSGATNLFNLYSDGGLLRVRWGADIEQSFGVYTTTTLDAQIALLKGFGKKFYILVDTQTYNDAVGQSWVPDYMRADTSTYGGLTNHGGETLKNGATGAYGVIWWNANVYARWVAFITAMANKYKSDASFGGFMLGESSCAYTAADITAAGGTAGLEQIYKNQMSDLATAFGSKNLIFPNLNFLPGDNGTAVGDLNTWLQNNGYNGGGELEFPVTQLPQYPKNVSANTSANYDASGVAASWANWPRTLGQKVYTFTDITVQWGVSTGFTQQMAQRILNYAAYLGVDMISFNTVFVGGDTLASQVTNGYGPLLGQNYLKTQ